MNNLLFFRRSDAYRHAGMLELRKARALPPGLERNEARKRARALKELAHSEAWLEGQNPRLRRNGSYIAASSATAWCSRETVGFG